MADPDTKQPGQQKNQGKWDPKDKNQQDKHPQDKGCQDKNAPGKSAGQDAPIHSRREDDARGDQNRGDQGANRGRQPAENATGMDDEDFKISSSESENPDQDAQDPSRARDQRPM